MKNMKKKLYISLKVKLTWVITFLLALVILFGYFYFPLKYEEARLLSLQEKVDIIASNAAYELSSGLFFKNNEAAKEEIESLIQNETIKYLVIYKDSSVFYQHNTFVAVLSDYMNLEIETISAKYEVMKSHEPIFNDNQKIGDIYIGYSLSNVYHEIDDLRKHVGIVSLIIFSICSVIVILIIIYFTNPLQEFIITANKISEGDFTQRVNIKSKDEIGIISNSFNGMVDKVATSNEEMNVITAELENRVKGRTKELEGALKSLQKENTQRKRAEADISSSLHEKEVLLKEIHHRVKNNLQIVSSLFFFQSKQITDPIMLDMFRDGQNRVKSMALIHEKLYQSGDLANIDFKEYIKKLTNFLLQSYGVNQSKIKLKNNVQHIKLGVDTAVPCGLIINELISNSLKHGFRELETGEIRIDMGYDEYDKLTLKISDNGKGMPKDLNIEESDSLGLRLVYNLTKQINGKVEFFNNNGASVKIVFPNPKLNKTS
jgi:two-component sensor histidine kinase/HAMP domain-containing protein